MRRLTLAMAVTLAMAPLAAAQAQDATAGARVFNTCRACHTINEGGRAGVGPNLWGIVGRRAASVEGFRYSANFRTLGEAGHIWTEENIRRYITNPKDVAPQGIMAYPGLRNEQQMNDLMAYLNAQR